MKEINKSSELFSITGGGFLTATMLSAIASGVIFLVGLFDGYLRPLKCRR